MNNMGVKISIITVTYNAAQTIGQTIHSVVNQTYPNIEYIIIDGGSTDRTVDIIEKYGDKIAYWVSQSDKGIYDAMNTGINVASGDYIQFLGADDILVNENIIQNVVENLMLGIDILSTGIYMVDEKLKLQIYAGNFSVRNREQYNGDMIPHPGLFVKKEVMKNNLFDINYRSAADYDFFLKCYLSNDIKFKYIDIATVFFSLGGLSSVNVVGRKEHIEIMKKRNLSVAIINKVENNEANNIKKYIKFFLYKCGCLGWILRKGNWKKHSCEWRTCRWCKGK